MSEEKQPAVVKKFDYYDDLADRLRKNSKGLAVENRPKTLHKEKKKSNPWSHNITTQEGRVRDVVLPKVEFV